MVDPKRTAKGLWWDRALTLTKGCTPVTEGCRHCWAASQSHIRSKQDRPPPCYVGVTNNAGKWTGHVEALPERLDRPLHVRKPTTWAVWNDLFHEDVPDEFIAAAFGVMAACPQHTFQVLTKRPERLRRWSQWASLSRCIDASCKRFPEGTFGHRRMVGACFAPWPLPNVHLGTSASTQADLERVVPDLLATPAAVRFLSLEPLLEEVNARGLLLSSPRPGDCECGHGHGFTRCPNTGGVAPTRDACDAFVRRRGEGIHWVIVGCESGPKRRPCRAEDARSVIEQCQSAGVPVFHKQMDIDGRVSKDMDEWPEDLRVREFPR